MAEIVTENNLDLSVELSFSEDNNILLRALPIVSPNPLSSGSSMNFP